MVSSLPLDEVDYHIENCTSHPTSVWRAEQKIPCPHTKVRIVVVPNCYAHCCRAQLPCRTVVLPNCCAQFLSCPIAVPYSRRVPFPYCCRRAQVRYRRRANFRIAVVPNNLLSCCAAPLCPLSLLCCAGVPMVVFVPTVVLLAPCAHDWSRTAACRNYMS